MRHAGVGERLNLTFVKCRRYCPDLMIVYRVKLPDPKKIKDRDAKSAAIALSKGPMRRRHLYKLLGVLSTERGEVDIELER
jgi:hypothetical protein